MRLAPRPGKGRRDRAQRELIASRSMLWPGCGLTFDTSRRPLIPGRSLLRTWKDSLHAWCICSVSSAVMMEATTLSSRPFRFGGGRPGRRPSRDGVRVEADEA